jgi:hypothetical protein
MKAGDLVKVICEISDMDEVCLAIPSTETRVGLYNKMIGAGISFYGDKHQVYVDGKLREYSEKLWKVEVLNER